MPNKFEIDSFDPVKLKKANMSLDKHFNAAKIHKITNDEYQKSLSQQGLLKRFLKFFRRS